MRNGFTTGSCAAAAAKAACYMLLTGKEKTQITIITPKGIPFCAEIVDISRKETSVRCAVIKDGGDDPDVTTGAHITATVSLLDGHKSIVSIDGGEGVGRVTKPGLDQPVGRAAINHVPREMIEKEVKEVCLLCDYKAGVKVEISVPEGQELAEKTFNPRLGIVGGISILGTSGIVEPMSEKALLDTICVELRQKKALGYQVVAVSPGNYGLDFMKRTYGYDLDKSVKCSNFIGDTLDMAADMGFSGLLLTGHIGKLIKVSSGVMNTHSKYGDRRMELLCEAAAEMGAEQGVLDNILQAVTTEEGVRILEEANVLDAVMGRCMEKIKHHLNERVQGKMKVECIMYSNEHGFLGTTEEALSMLSGLKGME